MLTTKFEVLKMFKWVKYIVVSQFFLPFGALALESSPEITFPIKPFTAQYNIIHNNDKVGKATRKLSYLDNGMLNYSYQTEIEWLIFSDKRSEKSVLKADLAQNLVSPVSYEYERSGTGRDKHKKWQFLPEQNKGTCINEDNEKHKVTLDFSVPLQDKLSYHLQQRLNLITNPEQKNFVYPVIQNSGKTKSYVYQYDGEEELMLPYGNVKTIRLKREVVEKKKITTVWFAPELNYLLVKLHQSQVGADQFEAQLTGYKEGKTQN